MCLRSSHRSKLSIFNRASTELGHQYHFMLLKVMNALSIMAAGSMFKGFNLFKGLWGSRWRSWTGWHTHCKQPWIMPRVKPMMIHWHLHYILWCRWPDQGQCITSYKVIKCDRHVQEEKEVILCCNITFLAAEFTYMDCSTQQNSQYLVLAQGLDVGVLLLIQLF